jgi:hypothetical protein
LKFSTIQKQGIKTKIGRESAGKKGARQQIGIGWGDDGLEIPHAKVRGLTNNQTECSATARRLALLGAFAHLEVQPFRPPPNRTISDWKTLEDP